MRDVEHPAAGHGQEPGLLDRLVSERGSRDPDRRDAPAFEVDEVAHTARRARASISESLDDRIRDGSRAVDEVQGRGLGENLLGRAARDRALGPQ
jgi:hypothetical protein